MVIRHILKQCLLGAFLFVLGALPSGAVSRLGTGPYGIDACEGHERGYLAVTVAEDEKAPQGYTAYFFLATVVKDVNETNLICWVPGDRYVIVTPPAFKVTHAPR